MAAPGTEFEAIIDRPAVYRLRGKGGAFVLGVSRLATDTASILAFRRRRLGGLTMSEEGGLEEVEESFRAAAIAPGVGRQWPSAFNRAS